MKSISQIYGRSGRPLFPIVILVSLLLIGGAIAFGHGVALAGPHSSGIVDSVFKAPIVPNGNVSGAPADFVVTLDRSLNPGVGGRSLPAGHQIRITLPAAFVNVRGYPGQTIFTPGCAPGAFECNTAILLQGWPQHPIFPMFPPGSSPPVFYETALEANPDGSNAIVITALQDVVPGLALPGPGIKQVHVFALGFDNPAPGFYDIGVTLNDAAGDVLEAGTGVLQIYPNVRPSINVTSVFNGPGNPNAIYQQTSPGAQTPLPYNFLLWDSNGQPLDGVEIEMVNDGRALLRRGEQTVGHVQISAPSGASGHSIATQAPSQVINAPVSGIPTARLTAFFQAGSATGRYAITFSLNNGNAVTMFVDVE